jgi:outer membrane protein assembly complex protein YaeT
MRPSILLLLLLCLAPRAAAQSMVARYVGRTVEEVRLFIENTPVAEEALLELIQVRTGRPLSMEDVRDSIVHVFSLRRFQDVRVNASDAPAGGVSVRFDLVPVHLVQELEFAGNLALSSGTVRSAVTDRFGKSPPIARTDEVARTLRRLYQDEGYLSASVRPEAEERHDPDRTVLRFQIEAGPRALIREARVEGDPRTSAEALLRRIEATSGAPYRAPRIQERLEGYRDDLRERGYYQATASVRPTPAGGNVVDLLVTVNAGPAVTVRYEGDRASEDTLDELVGIMREASIDEDLLEDAETRIEGYLRQQGYWKADVGVRQESGEGTLAVVFTIKRGLQYRVAQELEIRGVRSVPVAELRALFAGLEPGEIYRESELTAAVSAIGALYRTRGFAAVAVDSAPNELDAVRPGEGLIQPVIVVTEGVRTVIETVRLTGNTAYSEDYLRSRIRSAAGAPYYQPQILADHDSIVLEYLNLGFASVAVDVQPKATSDGSRMELTFAITEGAQTIVDHILIVGNRKTDPSVILGELQLREGAPLGFDARFESQRRLAQLGLFRRIRIEELTHGGTNRHDVVVTVEEAPATAIAYGGGVDFTQRLRATGPNGEAEEHLEFGPRGFFDIGRRNLGGRNRSVNLFTRLSLRPKDVPDDPEEDGTGLEISEYRVVATFRQPRAYRANDLNITGAIEQGVRSSFNFTRRGVNAELVRRLTPAIRVSGRYSFGTTRTYDERLSEEDQAQIDRAFPQVRLSGFSSAMVRDTRDDVLDPERGTFLSVEGSIAARALGGQVGFMKTYMQAFWFHRIPRTRGFVFATRAAVGLADGFERETQPLDEEGNPIPGPPIVVEDLPASERFFAGGDTTIRGYALDSVGAPDTISPTGFPTGGNSVLILNGELRLPVWRDIGAALFMDGGNVFRRVTQFEAAELRGSVGFGLRYASPIGPLRVDLGFKLDRRTIAGRLEPRTALHFSIGQAF